MSSPLPTSGNICGLLPLQESHNQEQPVVERHWRIHCHKGLCKSRFNLCPVARSVHHVFDRGHTQYQLSSYHIVSQVSSQLYNQTGHIIANKHHLYDQDNYTSLNSYSFFFFLFSLSCSSAFLFVPAPPSSCSSPSASSSAGPSFLAFLASLFFFSSSFL